MPTISSFEDLPVWRKARVFAQKVQECSHKGTFARDFPLKDQINSSSGSILDNIAEGYGRVGNKEFVLFLSYARGSADESMSQLYRALDRNHISAEVFEELKSDVIEIGKMITGFIVYLRRSSLRGSKFRPNP